MHRKYKLLAPIHWLLDDVFLASHLAKTLTNQVHNQQEKFSCMKQYDRGNPEKYVWLLSYQSQCVYST